MLHYRYNLVKLTTGHKSDGYRIDNLSLEESMEVEERIIERLLNEKRIKIFVKCEDSIIKDLTVGEISHLSVDEIKLKMSELFNNIGKLQDIKYYEKIIKFIKNLAYKEEIIDKYKIINIEKISLCDGCLYGYENQKGHMSCPTGCLHTMNDCDICDDVNI